MKLNKLLLIARRVRRRIIAFSSGVCEPACHYWSLRKGMNSIVITNNSLQYLSGKISVDARAHVCIYDCEGKLRYRDKYVLRDSACLALDLGELASKHPHIGNHGMISIQLKPLFFSKFPKSLGAICTQPYILYSCGNIPAGCVHCLSSLGDMPDHVEWVSGQSISTKDTLSITLHQINPSSLIKDLKYSIIELDSGVTVLTTTKTINARGATTFEFDVTSLSQERLYGIKANYGLPSCNAKPIIERLFVSGVSSFSHS